MSFKATDVLRLALAAAATLFCVGAAPALGANSSGWVGAWGYATSPAAITGGLVLPAGTYRYRIRPTQSGDMIRLTLSNPQNATALVARSLTIARAQGNSGFETVSTPVALKFAGGEKVKIAAGRALDSDPGEMTIRAGEDLIVTLVTDAPSSHVPGTAGFSADFASITAPTRRAALDGRPFVSLISVLNRSASCTIVTLGDSITEGARGKEPGWRGWPGRLAARMAAQAKTPHCGVVNMGISGNRLLREGRGTAMIERLDRDVASVPGASHLVLLAGINDLARSGLPGEPSVGTEQLIAGYRRVIAFAKARGLCIVGATMTPLGGSKYATPALEAKRTEANEWIRTSGEFDAIIDFDAALRDEGNPPPMRPGFASDDHLHPSDTGYAAMAEAVPDSLFEGGHSPCGEPK